MTEWAGKGMVTVFRSRLRPLSVAGGGILWGVNAKFRDLFGDRRTNPHPSVLVDRVEFRGSGKPHPTETTLMKTHLRLTSTLWL